MGPPVPLTRGLRSSLGRQRSPLPLFPWRRHSSRSGERRGRVLRLGSDVLGLAPCSPCWPPPARDPALACWGWRALATRLAPVACPRPWDGGSPRAGWGPPAPPPPLRGCQLAAPRCPFPPGSGVPLLVPAVTSLWVSRPLPVSVRRQGGGGWGWGAAVPS